MLITTGGEQMQMMQTPQVLAMSLIDVLGCKEAGKPARMLCKGSSVIRFTGHNNHWHQYTLWRVHQMHLFDHIYFLTMTS